MNAETDRPASGCGPDERADAPADGIAVPEGYVLMPLSITSEMRDAAMAVLMDGSNIHVRDDGAVSVETALPRLLLKAMADACPSVAGGVADADRAALDGLRSAIELLDCFGNEPGDRAMVLLERKDSSTFEMIDGRTNKPVTLSDLRRIAGSPGAGGSR